MRSNVIPIILKLKNRLFHNLFKTLKAYEPITYLRYHPVAPAIKKCGDKRIIYSLKSYPPRYPKLHLTLMTLVSQNHQADLIQLNIDAGTDYLLTKRSKAIIQKHNIQICEVDPSTKSYGKLVPTRTQHPKATIITADDDSYYPKDWARKLITASKAAPYCTVGYRARKIALDETGKPLEYQKWNQVHQPEQGIRIMLTGVSGILYPPNSIIDEALDPKKFNALAPTTDDLWFWRMTVLAGYIPAKIGPKVYNYGWSITPGALSEINVRKNRNDVALSKILQSYPLNFT